MKALYVMADPVFLEAFRIGEMAFGEQAELLSFEQLRVIAEWLRRGGVVGIFNSPDGKYVKLLATKL